MENKKSDDTKLSITAAAHAAEVSRSTIRRWIDEKGLPAERKGFRKTVIRQSDLDEFRKQFSDDQ
jgi:excisionase family DNA binding protein